MSALRSARAGLHVLLTVVGACAQSAASGTEQDWHVGTDAGQPVTVVHGPPIVAERPQATDGAVEEMLGRENDAAVLDAAFAPREDASVQAAGSNEPTMVAGEDDDAAVHTEAGAPDPGELDAAVEASAHDGAIATDADVEADADRAREPDAGPSCRPGSYKGTLQGSVRRQLSLLDREIAVSVQLRLAAANEAGLLPIEEGTIDGTDADGDRFRAGLSGSLNCATGRIEAGLLRNGDYLDALAGGPFQGDVTARLDANRRALQGSWMLTGPPPLLAGSGTWTVVLQN